MAWNKPSVKAETSSHQRSPCVSVCGLGVGLISVAFVSFFIWFVSTNDKHSRTADERNARSDIRIVSTSSKRGLILVATNKAVKTAAIVKPEVEHAEVFMKPKIEGRLVVWKRRDPPPVFTNQFEGYVADILTTTPGERFLCDTVNDNFDEEFEESLNHKIEINTDDSEDIVALKQAVIEAKEEVRRQVATGRKASEIVMESLREMNKIADYRDQVQAAFNSYLLTETDPKEVVKYEQEANAMLDEYDALHIDGPHDEEMALQMMIEAKEEKEKELSAKLEADEKKELKQ